MKISNSTSNVVFEGRLEFSSDLDSGDISSSSESLIYKLLIINHFPPYKMYSIKFWRIYLQCHWTLFFQKCCRNSSSNKSPFRIWNYFSGQHQCAPSNTLHSFCLWFYLNKKNLIKIFRNLFPPDFPIGLLRPHNCIFWASMMPYYYYYYGLLRLVSSKTFGKLNSKLCFNIFHIIIISNYSSLYAGSLCHCWPKFGAAGFASNYPIMALDNSDKGITKSAKIKI